MSNRPVGGFGAHWPEFMHSATEARDRVNEIETADPQAWPMRDALSAILFSAIAAEAFINELPEAASRDAYDVRNLQVPAVTVLENLAATLNAMEQARDQIQDKYHAARSFITGQVLQLLFLGL